MAETLDDAIREAKIEAGLDPDEKHPVMEYHEHIEQQWQRQFWERMINITIAKEPWAHDFLPVAGHPDDDECTFRADGTDEAYCGAPSAAHFIPEGSNDQ